MAMSFLRLLRAWCRRSSPVVRRHSTAPRRILSFEQLEHRDVPAVLFAPSSEVAWMGLRSEQWITMGTPRAVPIDMDESIDRVPSMALNRHVELLLFTSMPFTVIRVEITDHVERLVPIDAVIPRLTRGPDARLIGPATTAVALDSALPGDVSLERLTTPLGQPVPMAPQVAPLVGIAGNASFTPNIAIAPPIVEFARIAAPTGNQPLQQAIRFTSYSEQPYRTLGYANPGTTNGGNSAVQGDSADAPARPWLAEFMMPIPAFASVHPLAAAQEFVEQFTASSQVMVWTLHTIVASSALTAVALSVAGAEVIRGAVRRWKRDQRGALELPDITAPGELI
jgi:hypothetical protein